MGFRSFIKANTQLPAIRHASVVEGAGHQHPQASSSAASSPSASRSNSTVPSAYEVPIHKNQGKPYAAALELWSLTR